MLNLLEMKIYASYGKGPYVEIQIVILMVISVLILLVGFYRKRKAEDFTKSATNDVYEIQQYDMLGQPQIDHFQNLRVEEKILFSGVDRGTVIRYKWYGIITLCFALLLFIINQLKY